MALVIEDQAEHIDFTPDLAVRLPALNRIACDSERNRKQRTFVG